MNHVSNEYRLLNHPFYQAWSCGMVTKPQLSKYAESYMEFIEAMPMYWEKVTNELGAEGAASKKVIHDEFSHIPLWKEWKNQLPRCTEFPQMTEIMEAFASFTPSELLGAIHAFEIQQPEVAVTKKEGLLKFYGFKEEELHYFDEHQDEAFHIAFGEKIARSLANQVEFQHGFEKGQKLIYEALNKFM